MTAAAQLDLTLQALGDPHRRAVVELLKDGPKRAGDLAEAVELSPPAMSRHLRVLRDTGVVTAVAKKDDARVRLYALNPHALDALHAWLDEVRSYWNGQLEAFARAARHKRGERG